MEDIIQMINKLSTINKEVNKIQKLFKQRRFTYERIEEFKYDNKLLKTEKTDLKMSIR